ncbi:hypothetical protein Taro_045051 [Colocasia esculenta]|uniref:Thaumatin-like protein n=1 Tax=Colocasia esculenta TaxID=4460 RepID=A0A843WVK4_COLES|nr:hypothetical protein [Colocasia esculenta]
MRKLLTYRLSPCHGILAGAQSAAVLTVVNNCNHMIWPALFGSNVALSTTGFALSPGESMVVQGPAGMSGRVWARTLCNVDPSTNTFACATGDCGTGAVECSGRTGAAPATLVEFKLDGDGGKDFFDVSLVDGFNLPVEALPQALAGGDNSGAKCEVTNCPVDLNNRCPPELAMHDMSSGQVVACKSACLALGKDEYCCTGEYANPQICHETPYSRVFKDACPRAYSYAYDDATSTFTCASGSTNYLITFCPGT